jgi:hypothetical protein
MVKNLCNYLPWPLQNGGKGVQFLTFPKPFSSSERGQEEK